MDSLEGKISKFDPISLSRRVIENGLITTRINDVILFETNRRLTSCHTLKEWEEDLLRGMPNYNDRLKHQDYFESCLRQKNIPYIELQDSSLEDRVAVVVEEINALLNG